MILLPEIQASVVIFRIICLRLDGEIATIQL